MDSTQKRVDNFMVNPVNIECAQNAISADSNLCTNGDGVVGNMSCMKRTVE